MNYHTVTEQNKLVLWEIRTQVVPEKPYYMPNFQKKWLLH